jgi:hypothetical protein
VGCLGRNIGKWTIGKPFARDGAGHIYIKMRTLLVGQCAQIVVSSSIGESQLDVYCAWGEHRRQRLCDQCCNYSPIVLAVHKRGDRVVWQQLKFVILAM